MSIIRIERGRVLVDPDGVIIGGFEIETPHLGACVTDGALLMSDVGGENCPCGCSRGHWLTLVLPRDEDGVVEWMRLIFPDRESLRALLDNGPSSVKKQLVTVIAAERV